MPKGGKFPPLAASRNGFGQSGFVIEPGMPKPFEACERPVIGVDRKWRPVVRTALLTHLRHWGLAGCESIARHRGQLFPDGGLRICAEH
jgi:hypothetical protein